MNAKEMKVHLSSKPEVKNKLFVSLWEHKELIAALFSGLLLLIAWIIKDSIDPSLWIALHLIAFVIGGFAKAKEGIEETMANKDLNVEMLMIFAAIGSAAIGYWTEGAILIFIFALAGALETYTLNKSNKEISSLMALQPEEAILINNGKEQIVPITQLEIDDTILVRASDRIPADGKIIKGVTAVDESAITGESIPVQKQENSEVFAGTVALDGSITVQITKKANETLFQKIIEMVQNAKDEKSPAQLFIERFEGTYVKIVLFTVAVMMFAPFLLFNWTLTESIYRAMILLVVASPCALVASIMPATLSAISNSAKHGVLFKGGIHAENLSNVKAIAFDKTGTLTNGTPVVTDIYIDPEYNREQVITTVAAIENESTHPLADAIKHYTIKHYGNAFNSIDVQQMTTFSGIGITAEVDGEEWKIGKPTLVGENQAYSFFNGIAKPLADKGKTVIFVKRDHKVIALFALKDTIRETTKQAIQTLHAQGIYTVMLTGDNEPTARSIAKEAGMNDYIAECLPEKKVEHIKKMRKKYKTVAMVGDGINDAPALATANIGIAMGEGTDVALETADVVLMKNNLTKITDSIGVSNKMNKIIKQNIYFSMAVILLLIVANFTQMIDLPLGVVGHEGSTILVILNGLRLLKN